METKELLTIEKLKDLSGTLQMLGHTPLPSCKTYIINDEICVAKNELLNALLSNGCIKLECFTRSEVIKIIGRDDNKFPPDYECNNEKLWETYRVKDLVSKEFNLKGLEIEKFIQSKLSGVKY